MSNFIFDANTLILINRDDFFKHNSIETLTLSLEISGSRPESTQSGTEGALQSGTEGALKGTLFPTCVSAKGSESLISFVLCVSGSRCSEQYNGFPLLYP
jgi:hypothetical protein